MVATTFYTLSETAKLRREEPKTWLRRAVLPALETPDSITMPAARAGSAKQNSSRSPSEPGENSRNRGGVRSYASGAIGPLQESVRFLFRTDQSRRLILPDSLPPRAWTGAPSSHLRSIRTRGLAGAVPQIPHRPPHQQGDSQYRTRRTSFRWTPALLQLDTTIDLVVSDAPLTSRLAGPE